MSLAPVSGPLSMAAESVIVEVLVGWSPAIPRHSPPPPEVAWCPCGFPPRKKKARTTTSEPIKVFEFVFELLRFVCDVVSHLPRVIPRYLTEALLGIVVMLMVKCCNVKGLFSQRECYMGGFFFVNFEAPFMKPLFHRVEISLESG